MIAAINCFRPYECDCICRPVDFVVEQDVAQYKGSDYSNAVLVIRNGHINLEEAKKIALSNPEIDYFVQIKNDMMLEFPRGARFPANGDPLHLVSGNARNGYYRYFQRGDFIFFRNEGKWLGSAPGFADVYSKI